MLSLELYHPADFADETEYLMRCRLSATATPKLRCLCFCAVGASLKAWKDRSTRYQSFPAGPLLDVVEKRRRASSRSLREVILESLTLTLDSDTARADANRLTRKVRVMVRDSQFTAPGAGSRFCERRLVVPADSPPEYSD
ncbi:hypothetical protein AURDEDRAFT_115580 [Auricularia subglabra TFB-10046 SS5]|nr:hypothetical protein AURDEDRAFT_115580 [Auricularia subglabra TFB-10046 SS5]